MCSSSDDYDDDGAVTTKSPCARSRNEAVHVQLCKACTQPLTLHSIQGAAAVRVAHTTTRATITLVSLAMFASASWLEVPEY
jgi:hypothetical protein